MGRKSKILYSFFILIFFAALLVVLWFRDGYIMGTAEGGLPFYNLSHFYEQVRLAWSDSEIGLGFANGIGTAFAPGFLILSNLAKLGIPNFIIQAWFFWLLLVTAGIGIILFTEELFPKISGKYLLLSALFYWFNFISLVNIWNRFLYNYIALWALLPLAAAFFLKGLNKQNPLYILVVGIISVLFSLGLSNPVFNIILWLIFSYLTLFKLIISTNFKQKIFYIIFFLGSILYFGLVNIWWIGQVVRYLFLGKYAQDLASFYKDDASLVTLNSLSQSLGDLTNLFRFMHKSFFTTPFVEWATFFVHPLLVIIEFVITGIILHFLIKTRKNINVLLLGFLMMISIYLAKGSNPPLGEAFRFSFVNLSFLQFFRNPFEKFGFIIPLAAVPLLAAGLDDLHLRLRRGGGIFIYIILMGIIVGLYGYPFWSGLVFTSMFPPTNDYSVGYKVKVPDYYRKANNWLESRGQNFRFIGFPYNGQGVTYKWEKGFQGVEPSMWLFTTPHIMFSTTVLYFNQIADQLEEQFMRQEDFYKIMNILNVKYLMNRSDVDFHERNMRNPDKIKEVMKRTEENGSLREVAGFGQLNFWENPYWADRTIYATNDLIKVSPAVKLSDFTLLEATSTSVAYSGNLDSVDQMTTSEIIHPGEEKKDPEYKSRIYSVDIQDDGIYELVLDKVDASNSFVVLVDNSKFQGKFLKRTDGSLSLGSLNLAKGLHKFEVFTQESGNLISADTETNNFSVLDFDPFSKYLINFDYLISNNQPIKLMISQDNDQIKNGQIEPSYVRNLSGTPNNFANYKDLYEPRNTADSIEISFSPNSSNLKIKNIDIRKLINPDLVLIKSLRKTAESVMPQVDYAKNSLTHYIIRIRNSKSPFVLVFSSTFNPGWEIIFPDGTRAKNHFLINSYANGWLIDKLGDYDLVLNYSLQDNLKSDSMISIIAFVGGLLLLPVLIIFRRKNLK